MDIELKYTKKNHLVQYQSPGHSIWKLRLVFVQQQSPADGPEFMTADDDFSMTSRRRKLKIGQ